MKGKIKRIFVSFLAVLCAFSSIAVVGVGAATRHSTSTRTLKMSSEKGSLATPHIVTMGKAGYFTETFPSYPNVTGTYYDKNDKKEKSYVRSENTSYSSLDDNHTANTNKYILNENSPEHKTLFYYKLSKNKTYYIYHKHTKKGGFNCKVTSSIYYN